MSDHSILAPSSAHAWRHCTAYPLKVPMYPQQDTDESREGTEAHELAAEMILGAMRGMMPAAPDTEQGDAAAIYANDVVGVMRDTGIFADDLGFEQRITIGRIHRECFGTPDAYLFDRRSGRLYLWDFKYGHRVVDAYRNSQLTTYTGGLIERLGINGVAEQHISVEFRIVQPRAFRRNGNVIDTWVTPLTDLRADINQLEAAAAEVFSGAAQERSGPWCRDCPARFDCPTAVAAGMTLYEAANAPGMNGMSVQQLGVLLSVVGRALDQLGYIQSAVEEQLTARLRSGQGVPGWSLETSYARSRAWKLSEEQIVTMARQFGVDVERKALMTPTQAIKAGLDETIVKSLSERVATGVKLVRDENKAARIFAGV